MLRRQEIQNILSMIDAYATIANACLLARLALLCCLLAIQGASKLALEEGSNSPASVQCTLTRATFGQVSSSAPSGFHLPINPTPPRRTHAHIGADAGNKFSTVAVVEGANPSATAFECSTFAFPATSSARRGRL